MTVCLDGGQAVRRSAARWPLAQRAGDKPLRIVAAGRLVADPQLDGGAVAQYQAAGAGSVPAPVPGLGESGQVPGFDESRAGSHPEVAAPPEVAAIRDAAVALDAAATWDEAETPGFAAKSELRATVGQRGPDGAAVRRANGSATGGVAGRRGHRPVRLTRRGRLVVLALLVLLLGALAALVAIPSQAAAPAGPARVVVVQPGDSLWSIVERYRPGADPVRAMDELVAANDLSGSTVYPGEELVLPTQW